jgi:hypothetical protein
MSNPQQPELARSRKTPAQDPDSVATVVEGQRQPEAKGPGGPVPAENQPGHHPETEQDKPDLDAFAARLGVTDEPGGSEEASTSAAAPAAGGGLAATQIVAAVAGALAFLGGLLMVVRRRRRAS